MATISYARHQFPPDVIRHAVWLYLRFTLSYRDVEEMLAERGAEQLFLGSPRSAAVQRVATRLAFASLRPWVFLF